MDILAVASVQAGAAGFNYNKGCAQAFNSGVGLQDITLDNPADAAECGIYACVVGAAAGTCTVQHISDTVKRVSTFIAVAGVPTLSNAVPFTFLLIR